MVVAATGPGSSSTRLITGLFEGHHSYIEYVPDPQIAQYILSSRKRKSEVAAKHIYPRGNVQFVRLPQQVMFS